MVQDKLSEQLKRVLTIESLEVYSFQLGIDLGDKHQGKLFLLHRLIHVSTVMPSLFDGQLNLIGQLGQVGAARENLDRMRLQDEMSRFEFGQQEPINRTMQFMQALGGSAPLIGGAGTTTVQQPGMNPLMMGLGAATTLGGAALGNPFAFF